MPLNWPCPWRTANSLPICTKLVKKWSEVFYSPWLIICRWFHFTTKIICPCSKIHLNSIDLQHIEPKFYFMVTRTLSCIMMLPNVMNQCKRLRSNVPWPKLCCMHVNFLECNEIFYPMLGFRSHKRGGVTPLYLVGTHENTRCFTGDIILEKSKFFGPYHYIFS